MTELERLLAIMRRLRDPRTGCPWDRAQDFKSIAPHTIEEAYEVADAIERDDLVGLRDELGDLLFQVVFHARIAEERGAFDLESVAAAISEKLERRHPHVFGDDVDATERGLPEAWEAHKAAERHAAGSGGTLDGVALGLPALTRALKLGNRAARVGFDWPGVDGVINKVAEERDELLVAIESGDHQEIEHELGDLLFALVNLARHLKVDPEAALRRTGRRFEERFRLVEEGVHADGHDISALPIEDLEVRWQMAKARLKR